MPRFVYDGPPDEPDVEGVFNALTGEWSRGVPRTIDDPQMVAWLTRNPHWRRLDEVEAEDAAGEVIPPPPVAPARRGRPPKVRDNGDA